jgi:hypothetical protein
MKKERSDQFPAALPRRRDRGCHAPGDLRTTKKDWQSKLNFGAKLTVFSGHQHQHLAHLIARLLDVGVERLAISDNFQQIAGLDFGHHRRELDYRQRAPHPNGIEE